MSPDGEATGKAGGVPVAMLQGHSWAPRPSNGSRVNVGTILAVPSNSAFQGTILGGGDITLTDTTLTGRAFAAGAVTMTNSPIVGCGKSK
jgi:hypothetical protein